MYKIWLQAINFFLNRALIAVLNFVCVDFDAVNQGLRGVRKIFDCRGPT